MLRLKVYDLIEKIRITNTGPLQRLIGKNLALKGLQLQGALANDDRLVPSIRQKQFNNTKPQIDEAQFIAPNACIIGEVKLGEMSSIWYGAVIRGDTGKINIGNNVIIQDLNIEIQDNVFIGANSYIESCNIKDNSFIGMGQRIL